MADARELIAETRAQLKAVEDKLFAHPYLSAVEEGRIAKEKLRLFAGEQYYIINSDWAASPCWSAGMGTAPTANSSSGRCRARPRPGTLSSPSRGRWR